MGSLAQTIQSYLRFKIFTVSEPLIDVSPGYGLLGVFTLYSLISVEKWMKSL